MEVNYVSQETIATMIKDAIAYAKKTEDAIITDIETTLYIESKQSNAKLDYNKLSNELIVTFGDTILTFYS